MVADFLNQTVILLNFLGKVSKKPVFLGLGPKLWVGGGPKSKQPKKQNKPNFYFSLSGVPNVRGGWVGSDVWDKVPKKKFFFTPSLIFKQIQIRSVVGINNSTSPFTHRTLDSVFLSHLLPRNISYSNPPPNMMGDVSGKEDCQRHYGSRHRPTKSTI